MMPFSVKNISTGNGAQRFGRWGASDPGFPPAFTVRAGPVVSEATP